MKRFVLFIAAAGLFLSAAMSDAAPRRWRVYDDYSWNVGPGYYDTYGYSYPYYSNGTYYSSPGSYYGTYTYTAPWTSTDWYKSAAMTSRGSEGAMQSGIVQTNYETISQPSTPQYGLFINEVLPNGVAKKADLRPGDIIVGVGTTRTQSFEELQKAVSAGGNLEVVFLNHENRKMEKVKMTPVDGKIGVAVTAVTLR